MNKEINKKKLDFDNVVKKYKLNNNLTADKISKYLTSNKNISVLDFANEFGIEKMDAKLFLDFILMGVKFKEKHIDSSNSNN